MIKIVAETYNTHALGRVLFVVFFLAFPSSRVYGDILEDSPHPHLHFLLSPISESFLPVGLKHLSGPLAP